MEGERAPYPPAVSKITAVNSEGYPAPAGLAADAVVFTLVDERLHVLLYRRGEEPQRGVWSLPGGFVDIREETSEQTARRKLHEKTGVTRAYLEQLRTYDAVDRDSRGRIPSVAYLALVDPSSLPEGDDAAWWPVDDLPQLIFDHAQMISDGLQRLRGKLWWSNIAMGLLPERFTIREAQLVYQALSGREFNRANFERKFRGLGLIQPTDERRTEGRGRPAKLYEYVSREPAWVPDYGADVLPGV